MKNIVALLMLISGIGAIVAWQLLVVPTVAEPIGDQAPSSWQHNEMTFRQLVVTCGTALSVGGLMLLLLPGRGSERHAADSAKTATP